MKIIEKDSSKVEDKLKAIENKFLREDSSSAIEMESERQSDKKDSKKEDKKSKTATIAETEEEDDDQEEIDDAEEEIDDQQDAELAKELDEMKTAAGVKVTTTAPVNEFTNSVRVAAGLKQEKYYDRLD